MCFRVRGRVRADAGWRALAGGQGQAGAGVRGRAQACAGAGGCGHVRARVGKGIFILMEIVLNISSLKHRA